VPDEAQCAINRPHEYVDEAEGVLNDKSVEIMLSGVDVDWAASGLEAASCDGARTTSKAGKVGG
jgi:hypothetical protein